MTTVHPSYYELDNGDWCLPVAKRLGGKWNCLYSDDEVRPIPAGFAELDVTINGAEEGDILGTIIFRVNKESGEISQ